MTKVSSLASMAALIGEPARTAILVALMDGRALTAGELAEAANITASTASGHLVRLLDEGLLSLARQGRHRYYRLSGPAVATMLEGMMATAHGLEVARAPRKPIITGPRDRPLRRSRLCYDHLAGEVAVAIADNMIARGQLEFSADGGAVTKDGLGFLAALGIELPAATDSGRRRSTFCRPCLDWSERRPHIGGIVGRRLYSAFVDKGWMRRPDSGRAVVITPRGSMELERVFGLGLA
jgi:DNA-binding transcriptional ArsR family regulator